MLQFSFRLGLTLGGLALGFTGCRGDRAGSVYTAVSRNFDRMVAAIAGCRTAAPGCEADAASNDAACGQDCQARAGRSDEQQLATAIRACRRENDRCWREAEGQNAENTCVRRLRDCIGETRTRDASAGLCFIQLRGCSAGTTPAGECTSASRACVIALLADDAALRRDAGAESGRDADSVAPADAAMAEPAADEPTGGADQPAAASDAGASPSQPNASADSDAGGPTAADARRACMREREACRMRGEPAKGCARAMRDCKHARR